MVHGGLVARLRRAIRQTRADLVADLKNFPLPGAHEVWIVGESREITLTAAQAAMGQDVDVILGRIDSAISRERQAMDSLLHRIVAP